MKKLSVPMTRYELILGWIYMVLQYTAVPFILSIIIVILSYFGKGLTEAEISFLSFLANFVCVIAIFWKFLWRNAKTGASHIWKTLLTILIAFAGYWILNILISYLILTFFPEFYNVNDDAIAQMVAENPALMTFGTVILVPLAEEVLYRGLVFRGIYNHSRIAAYLVSIGIFAALHVVSYLVSYLPTVFSGSFDWSYLIMLLLCFVQYIPAGLCLGWAYAKSDSIWAPIVMHMGINLIGMFAMR